jgi:hypothetical protein
MNSRWERHNRIVWLANDILHTAQRSNVESCKLGVRCQAKRNIGTETLTLKTPCPMPCALRQITQSAKRRAQSKKLSVLKLPLFVSYAPRAMLYALQTVLEDEVFDFA